METFLILLVLVLLLGAWTFTWWRTHTSEYDGRYTRQRWLASILNTWEFIAYWVQCNQLRKHRR